MQKQDNSHTAEYGTSTESLTQFVTELLSFATNLIGLVLALYHIIITQQNHREAGRHLEHVNSKLEIIRENSITSLGNDDKTSTEKKCP